MPVLQNNPFVPPTGCPVNRLPNELLAHIFCLGAAADLSGEWDRQDEEDDVVDDDNDDDFSDVDDEDSKDHSEVAFQVLVSHVCDQWRSVALDTPALWAHISFYPNQRLDGEPTEWLLRSKAHPLRIEIDFSQDIEDLIGEEDAPQVANVMAAMAARPNDPDVAADPAIRDVVVNMQQRAKALEAEYRDRVRLILDLILPTVDRWQELELMVNDFSIAFDVLSRLAPIPAAPLLERLALYHYEDCEEYDRFQPDAYREPYFLPFRGNAPKLTHVSLWGVHIDWSDRKLLSNVRDLELAYHTHDVRPPYEDFVAIVCSNPRLETLTLCCSGPRRPSIPTGELNLKWPKEPLNLSCVRNIVLAFMEEDYATPLIQRLHLPNLESIVIDFESGDFTQFVSELCAPLPQLSEVPVLNTRTRVSQITHLKLGGLPCAAHAVTELYSSIPQLESLQLNMNHLDLAFMMLLTGPQSSTRRIPNTDPIARTETRRMVPGPQGPIYHPENSGVGEVVQVITLNAETATVRYLPLLTNLTISGVTSQEVKDLVEARAAHGGFAPLKKLLLDNDDHVMDEDLMWLRSKVDEVSFFDNSEDEDDEGDLEDDEEDEDEDEDDEMDVDGNGLAGVD